MAVTKEQIVAEAREWMDTPWRHQAKKKGVATDCAGVVIGVGKNTEGFRSGDLESEYMERFDGYGPEPIPKMMFAALDYMLVRTEKEQIGNVCFFFIPRPGGGGDPQHLGIISRVRPYMCVIHGYNKPGIYKVVETRVVNKGYIRGMWRYPMVEE